MYARKGDRGEQIIRIQNALVKFGFPIQVDGIFGDQTHQAVIEFQRENELDVDGIVGPKTLTALELMDMLKEEIDINWALVKSEIARIATEECQHWHDGKTKRETDPEISSILKRYYRIGVNEDVTEEQLQNADWQKKHPWSAVFISYIIRKAGGRDKFRYAKAHQKYIADAKRNREQGNTENPFWAFPIDQVAIEVGDLICSSRGGSNATYENIEEGFKMTHCDIVTAINANQITIVGGNIKNTVGQRFLELNDNGFVIRSGRQKRIFAVIKLRQHEIFEI
ncbi:MAG: DUF2272 domain-containing protein [Ardenticatenaceae bacterium]|nr:DUF2272 domain-containing protein [Ardenticatenaceae bacterium]MCB8949342.1 DUF2272 domain-containing protein [Ardenticatenaceae bacterium]